MSANLIDPKPRSSGRPRSEPVRRMILATAMRLLEKQSMKALSIEGIAKAAGVSKATIYRWWDSKAAIVIDAFIEHHVVRTPMRTDIPPGDALAEHFRALVGQYAGLGGRIVAQILAEAQYDPEIAREFRARFHDKRGIVVRDRVEEWRRSGVIPRTTNIAFLMDMIYAPIYLRLLTGHLPLNAEFAREYPAFVFSLLGAPQPVVHKRLPQADAESSEEISTSAAATVKGRRRGRASSKEPGPGNTRTRRRRSQ